MLKIAPTSVYLAACVLIWGSNWPLVKMVLGDCPPFTFLFLRTVGAVIVLALLLLALGQRSLLPRRGERRDLALVGLLSLFAALTCSTAGLKFSHVGRAMVLMYTMQLWAVPLGFWLAGDRPNARRLLGSAIGVAGVVLFLGPGSIDWRDVDAVVGSALLVLSAICWALGACLYRRRPWGSGGLQQLLWQLLVCIPPAFAFALSDAREFRSTGLVWVVLAYNWTAATALGYWAWNKALMSVPAAVAGQVVLFAPLLGFVWSTVFFGERWSVMSYTAAALIVSGILVTLRQVQQSRAPQEKGRRAAPLA